MIEPSVAYPTKLCSRYEGEVKISVYDTLTFHLIRFSSGSHTFLDPSIYYTGCNGTDCHYFNWL